MATVTYIREKRQSLSAMRGVIDYCSQEMKTVDEDGRRYLSGVNCTGEHVMQEFLLTKQSCRKTDGINFYQYVQSFSPEEGITHAQAHEIALEFAAKAWPGHEVLVATHCDTNHPHSHFVINSVSFETGYKLRQHPNTVKQLRALSDEICIAHGFSVLKPELSAPVGAKKMSAREYRAAEKGQSWKLALTVQINDVMKVAANKEEFLALMEAEGYSLRWTPERKYITYQCPNGMKCRDNKLHDTKYTKERIELEFRIRAEIARRIAGADAPSQAGGRRRRSLLRRDGTELEGPADPGTEAQRADAGAAETRAGPDDGRRDEQSCRLSDGPAPQFHDGDGGSDRTVSTDADVGSERLYERGADGSLRFVQTGWERERLVFLRAAERAYRNEALSEKALLDLAPADGDHPTLSAGLGTLAAVGSLFDDDSEDPEERQRRIQAAQTARAIDELSDLLCELITYAKHHGETQTSIQTPQEPTLSHQSEPFFQMEDRSEAENKARFWHEDNDTQLTTVEETISFSGL